MNAAVRISSSSSISLRAKSQASLWFTVVSYLPLWFSGSGLWRRIDPRAGRRPAPGRRDALGNAVRQCRRFGGRRVARLFGPRAGFGGPVVRRASGIRRGHAPRPAAGRPAGDLRRRGPFRGRRRGLGAGDAPAPGVCPEGRRAGCDVRWDSAGGGSPAGCRRRTRRKGRHGGRLRGRRSGRGGARGGRW